MYITDYCTGSDEGSDTGDSFNGIWEGHQGYLLDKKIAELKVNESSAELTSSINKKASLVREREIYNEQLNIARNENRHNAEKYFLNKLEDTNKNIAVQDKKSEDLKASYEAFKASYAELFEQATNTSNKPNTNKR